MCFRSDGAKGAGQEPPGPEGIKEAIRNKYAAVAVSAQGKFNYPLGREAVLTLGYNRAIVDRAHDRFFESSCPVGNPFSLGAIPTAGAILDFGCGAGFDLFIAGTLAGPAGRLCGVDLTEEMAAKARENLALAGMTNCDIRKIDSEILPFDDALFDVVISNGVINLSSCKQTVFKEIHRVLKPGGKLQFADVVLQSSLPAALTRSAESWSQ